MWSSVVFVSFSFLFAFVNSQRWTLCGNNCSKPWYGWDYVREYSQDVYYQIEVKSFKDSDGDGIGDLNGIIEKLGYLKELGVDGAILSPVLKTAANDNGVQDFMTIDPVVGTHADFKKLLEKAAELDLKIIINFIPNHTSLLHEWFELSANRTERFKEFYVWQECPLEDGKRTLPNNWISVYNTPAWTYHEGRGECYLHQFSSQQPDLNFRNPVVYQKMLDVLEYWIGEGVSGFKLDAVNQLFESQGFPDEKYVGDDVDKTKHKNLVHTHTKNRLESYQFIYDAREMMDLAALNSDRKVNVLIVDVSDATAAQKAQWYGFDDNAFGAHAVLNFALTETIPLDEYENFAKNSGRLFIILEDYESAQKKWAVPNWALGGPNESRLAWTYPIHHEQLAIMSFMFPGTNFFYYGAEIGMTDNLNILIDGENDFRRARTPFQWDDTRHAGFSNTSGETWLPVNTNSDKVNLKMQENDDESTFKMYKQLIELRKEKEVLRIGKLYVGVLRYNNEVFYAERRYEQYPSIMTFINLVNKSVNMTLWDVLPRYGYPTKTTARVLFTRKFTSLESGEPMKDVEGSFELGPHATVIVEVCSGTKVLVSLLLVLLSFVTQLFS